MLALFNLKMYKSEQRKLERALKTVRSIRLEPALLRVTRWLLATYDASRNPSLEGLGHQEIANVIGTNRETVTNALNELEQKGLLTKSRMQIVLVDVPALRQLLKDNE